MFSATPRLTTLLGAFGTAAILLAWAIVSVGPSGPAAAQTPDREVPHISVSGEGEVRAEPDLAIISLSVAQTGTTSQEAMDLVNRSLTAVIASARGLGVESRDLQTSGLSLQPVYRTQQRPTDAAPEIIGYRASNGVTATVRDLNRAGAVLDAAIAAGANSVGGIRFGLSNTDALRRQALALATRDAESKAQAIATAAGVGLAGVWSITESSISSPQPQSAQALRAVGGDAAVSTPVEGGELVIRARLQASYRI